MYQEAIREPDISDDPSHITNSPWQREGNQQIGQLLFDKLHLRCCPHLLHLFVDSFCVPCVVVLVLMYKLHHTAKPPSHTTYTVHIHSHDTCCMLYLHSHSYTHTHTHTFTWHIPYIHVHTLAHCHMTRTGILYIHSHTHTHTHTHSHETDCTLYIHVPCANTHLYTYQYSHDTYALYTPGP